MAIFPKRFFWSALLSLTAFLLPGSLQACPLCASNTAQQVRAGLLNEQLGYNLLVMALPFVLLIGIVAVTYYGFPWPGKAKGEQ